MIRLGLDPETLAEFCLANQISRLSLFGSILGENFRPDSDVDVLVEFLPDARVGLLSMARMERELGELIGRKVDLRTPLDLSRYFRDRVLAEAELQYARCTGNDQAQTHARPGAGRAGVHPRAVAG